MAAPTALPRTRAGLRRSVTIATLLGVVLIGLLAGFAGQASAAAPTAPPPVAPSAPAPVPSVVVPSVVPSVPIPLNPDDRTPAAPAGSSGDLNVGGDTDPGFFDVSGRIRKAINDWFRSLVTTAAAGVLDALGKTVLISPDPSTSPRVRDSAIATARSGATPSCSHPSR